MGERSVISTCLVSANITNAVQLKLFESKVMENKKISGLLLYLCVLSIVIYFSIGFSVLFENVAQEIYN